MQEGMYFISIIYHDVFSFLFVVCPSFRVGCLVMNTAFVSVNTGIYYITTRLKTPPRRFYFVNRSSFGRSNLVGRMAILQLYFDIIRSIHPY